MRMGGERRAALLSGAKMFFTGRPCKRGHIAERFAAKGECLECVRYRRRKPEVLAQNREHNRRYRERDPEAWRERSRQWRAENPGKTTDIFDKWKIKNPDKTQKMVRECAARWRSRHPEKVLDLGRQWAARNRWLINAYAHTKRARKRSAPGSYAREDIDRIFRLQGGKCAEPTCRVQFGAVKYTVDHIIAIAEGGSNWPRNLQLLCKSCNSQKWRRDPIEHARIMGRLL